jgi:hypothetical protein
VSRFAIFGSGFGLYGYLPALVADCGQRVVLPERYRVKFQTRTELHRFGPMIDWVACDADALRAADGIVLARRPHDQASLAQECLRAPNIRVILLEKPLAPSPAGARALLRRVLASGKIARVGYTFLETRWATEWQATRPAWHDRDRVSIEWRFLAHHFRHGLESWKTRAGEGGGTLRFYGIQVIALLAKVGYCEIRADRRRGTDRDQPVREWAATASGPNLPECRIVVEPKATDESFSLCHVRPGTAILETNLTGPFAQEVAVDDGLDIRTGLLGRICRNALAGVPRVPSWYPDVQALWARAESPSAGL